MSKAKITGIDYMRLFNNPKIGPNGHSKELIEIATAPRMMEIYSSDGATKYFRKLRKEFSKAGLYRDLIK